MSEGLVPVVTRPPVARTGSAAMALPAVIVDAGPVAVERFLEFFAASIANGRTRAAYGRAVGQFLSWCAARGLGLRAIAPLHVAAYIRTHPGSAPTVKQHLAAIRVLCDWLVVHQVLPVNPAAAVRGPKHVVTKGATPVLTPAETRSLLDGIDPGSLVGLRDRALLSVMVYSFARVSAVVGMRRRDYFLQGTRGWLRLHEKGGKRHDVPAHHRAEAAVEAYLVAGGIEDAKAPLFQSVDRSRRLSGRSLTRRVVLAMIKRRAVAAGLPASTCCHTFRATGITALSVERGPGHQVGIDTMLAPRLDNQHQRGDVARAVVRLRDAHGLDVHHEGRQHGRATEQHRSTDRDRAGGRQRVAHQPLETDLVGRRAGAQHPVPVRQPIAVPQDAAGAVVGLYDPPTPVQVEDAYPWVVEQGGHGRVPRLGADQRLPDTDELTDMGQQFRDQGSQ